MVQDVRASARFLTSYLEYAESPAHMRNMFTRPEPVPTLGECAPASPRPLSLDNAALDPSCVGLPLLYVSSGGTISVVLAQEIVVEITTDRTVR